MRVFLPLRLQKLQQRKEEEGLKGEVLEETKPKLDNQDLQQQQSLSRNNPKQQDSSFESVNEDKVRGESLQSSKSKPSREAGGNSNQNHSAEGTVDSSSHQINKVTSPERQERGNTSIQGADTVLSDTSRIDINSKKPQTESGANFIQPSVSYKEDQSGADVRPTKKAQTCTTRETGVESNIRLPGGSLLQNTNTLSAAALSSASTPASSSSSSIHRKRKASPTENRGSDSKRRPVNVPGKTNKRVLDIQQQLVEEQNLPSTETIPPHSNYTSVNNSLIMGLKKGGGPSAGDIYNSQLRQTQQKTDGNPSSSSRIQISLQNHREDHPTYSASATATASMSSSASESMLTSAAEHRSTTSAPEPSGSSSSNKNRKKSNTSYNNNKASPTIVSSTFREALKQRGLEEVEQEGDGNCLFRAVSLQVYGDPDAHMDVRRRCIDFMAKDQTHYSQFVNDESFEEYLLRKRRDGVHGNNPEIQAISELYNRPVEVFVPEPDDDYGPSSSPVKPLNIFQSEYKTCDAPIRLSYHDGNHYNAIIDPLLPTAGLGLGLPGLQPGLADKMQLQKAVEDSEDQFYMQKMAEDAHEMDLNRALEESMRYSSNSSSKTRSYNHSYNNNMMMKKKASFASSFAEDLDETDFDMEQAAVLSSLETFHRAEGSRKQSSNQNYSGSDANPGHDANVAASTSNVASLPIESSPLYASSRVAAGRESDRSQSSAHSNENSHINDRISSQSLSQDEYPQCVQELVMNGFELQKVLKAYDLIGDNFDNLLSFLMSTSS